MIKIQNSKIKLFIPWMVIEIMKTCGSKFAILMTKFKKKKKNDFNIFKNVF